MQILSRVFLQLFFVFLWCASGLGQTMGQGMRQVEADLIWIQHGPISSALLHSRLKKGKWTQAKHIVKDNSKFNTPCIIRGKNDIVWAFWSVLQGEKSELYFTRKEADCWSEAKLVPTGMSFNGGSTVVLDADDIPWLFWVGNNGGDDDIYCSSWQQSGWKAPVRVHQENSTPDILPFAGIDERGRVWVAWSGFNGSAYQEYFSRWQGNHWSARTPLIFDNSLRTLITRRLQTKISFPDALIRIPSSYVDIQDGDNRFRSFRLILQQNISLH